MTKLTTLAGLTDAGLITPSHADALRPVVERYAVAISPEMHQAIREETDSDSGSKIASHGPLARQFVPDPREAATSPAETADPIGDEICSPVEGLVHRYPDRVLLKYANVCPVYCRFCFRRETVGPGQSAVMQADDLNAALAYIRANPAIFEVIVSGGDPLALSARHLNALTSQLADIPHIGLVRWHTRVPVVAPKLIDAARIEALATPGKTNIIAIHANHASEFSQATDTALAALSKAGIMLLSQTVLLRGINDDPDSLADLMRAFLTRGIKPYYLHHPDLAPGTRHFRLPIEEGQRIVAALRERISGIAMPTYVLDSPQALGKIPLVSPYVTPDGKPGRYRLTTPSGRTTLYEDDCDPAGT